MKNRACCLDSLSKRYDARYQKNNRPFVLQVRSKRVFPRTWDGIGWSSSQFFVDAGSLQIY